MSAGKLYPGYAPTRILRLAVGLGVDDVVPGVVGTELVESGDGDGVGDRDGVGDGDDVGPGTGVVGVGVGRGE
jgi:hypothetical protein